MQGGQFGDPQHNPNAIRLPVSIPVGSRLDEFTVLRAVMSEKISERHASACRYKNEVPLGSRRSPGLISGRVEYNPGAGFSRNPVICESQCRPLFPTAQAELISVRRGSSRDVTRNFHLATRDADEPSAHRKSPALSSPKTALSTFANVGCVQRSATHHVGKA